MVVPDVENPYGTMNPILAITKGPDWNDLTEIEKSYKVLIHFNRHELDDELERPLLRSFYWSAYFGDIKNVRMMINDLLWSPFMKSFEKKDCLTAAIRGRQPDIVAMLLSEEFVGVSKHDDE